jgi:hypothetical protein
MPATVETLQTMLSDTADYFRQYLKTTPPDRQRGNKLTLIRRLCHQCGIGTRYEVSPKTARTLTKLYESYVDSVFARVKAENVKPGALTEAGLLLRYHRITAQSIDGAKRVRTTAPQRPSLVASQGLPFTAAGERVGGGS